MSTDMRNPELDHLIRTRGYYIAFYDPTGDKHGIPTYPFRCAPDGYATIRQLRAQGLRPGGQHVQAQILWRHRKHVRVAHLYRMADAKPKRTATPAQLVAIAKRCGHAAPAPTAGRRRATTSRPRSGAASTATTTPATGRPPNDRTLSVDADPRTRAIRLGHGGEHRP